MEKIIHFIDSFTEKIGKISAWLVIPLTLGLVYEVFARYMFHAPTVWAYDLSYMFCGTLFMMGAAYTLNKGAHVRVDVFYRLFSPRGKATIDACLYIVFFFPVMFFLIIKGADYAWYAVQIQERAAVSPWRPFVWPLKLVLPISITVLLIQGIAEFLRCLQVLFGRKTN
ncbi:MAG: TRAP transporter small permease subunit [Deltaproteobacteria bacterium]|nr:TRAP transporter small permease subunit [Deltaproteobacteria bacterium]MBW2306900.1 TRAP transporter small permease subunit [Deltaproteobacteria bacterium]